MELIDILLKIVMILFALAMGSLITIMLIVVVRELIEEHRRGKRGKDTHA